MIWIVLSYIFNFLGLGCFIISYLVKGRKMGVILFLNFCGNAWIGFAYLADGKGINGAISSFLGAFPAIINYFFSVREKRLPIWLIGVYACAFIAVNLWLGGITWATALAIVACLCSVMAIAQSSGKQYRIWSLCNSGFWGIYDILMHTYGGLIIHVVLFLFTLVGMFINDKKTEKTSDEDKSV